MKEKAKVQALELTEQIESTIAPVLEVEPVIKQGNIGLLRDGSNSLIQIHASMRRHYEGKEGWTIVEPELKKK